ncbi:MAG TPA: VWA domain-containing protein [Thermoanaerobaculia bacterium]|nr:VWA domain-containing protein [Thermoanaerobaculia bacterium]
MSPLTFRRLSLSLPLAALLAAPIPAPAQSKAPAAPAPVADDKFEDTSQVVAVEVPVNVIGRDGQPVRGLTAADFEVFDGGDSQPITGFEVIDLSSRESATRRQQEAARVEELGSSARRNFLLLFDLSFATPTAILKARLAARDFLLESLHPSDLAAVATYSLETGPKLVLNFTPDRAQLARAIDTLGLRHVMDARDRDPLRFIITQEDDVAAATSSGGTGSGPEVAAQRDQALSEQLQSLAFQTNQSQRAFEVSRISAYTRSLGEMARSLNAVDGRKHVLFFSEGFDSRLLVGNNTQSTDAETDNANAIQGRIQFVDNDARYGNTGLQRDVGRMLEEFRRADCVIQAVDVGGLRNNADATGKASTNGQESLFYLANETGGELFKDANDLGGQLDRVLTRTSVTYLLTFQRSDLKHDGAYRRLRVKVKDAGQGARVSYRSGYYAPRPFKDLDPLEKTLLAANDVINASAKREVAIGVLAAPFRANEAQAYVPVIIEVDGKTLLTGHDGEKLGLEIYAYVTDKEGKIRDFFSQMVNLDLKQNARESLGRTGIKYYGHLDLQPGDYRVRVLVRNMETGRTGSESVPLAVPTYSKAEPHLLPPLFMEAEQGWLMIREREGEKQQTASVVYPFTVKGEPYVPTARPVLDAEKEVSLCLVGYNLGKGDLRVEGTVLARDGKALDGGRLALVERTATGISGLDKVLATFNPVGLSAGSYVLQVAVRDGNGLREASSLPFDVR